MTALWVSLAVVVGLLLVWRIYRATKAVDRILSEELDSPERPTDVATQPDEQRNRRS